MDAAVAPPNTSEVHHARVVEDDLAVHTPVALPRTRNKTCSCRHPPSRRTGGAA
jgi:hypothetical protein